MDKFLLAILTFIGGYYTKKHFDNRDLRRKILEPVFNEFEKNIIYLQTEWRELQLNNINQKNFDEYSKVYNDGKDRLRKAQADIVFACKKIREKVLVSLIDQAFSNLNKAMSDYSYFLERRDDANIDERQELIRILNEANTKFDKTFPAAMEQVYNRYWILISETLFIESIKSKLRNIINKTSLTKRKNSNVQ